MTHFRFVTVWLNFSYISAEDNTYPSFAYVIGLVSSADIAINSDIGDRYKSGKLESVSEITETISSSQAFKVRNFVKTAYCCENMS